MKEYIRKILEEGNKAPSGENCQPWKFKVKGDVVSIFLLPERDQSLYSWGQRASFVAIGALLENIYIASSQLGYKASTIFFPTNDKNHIADITFTKEEITPQPLFSAINSRVTNRKPFNTTPLSAEEVSTLKNCSRAVGYGSVLITENRQDIKELAAVGGLNEEIMISNKHLHNFFFEHINWTKEQDTKNKIGFYIETLELPLLAKKIFKLISNWNIAKSLNKIGFYKAISKQNAKIYSSCSAIGIITAEGGEPLDYIKAGQLVERVWLEATRLGLSLQPLTGVLYFKLQIQSNNTDKFTSEQIKKIEKGYGKIENIFNIKEKVVPFMFRIGRAENPSAKSTRFNIETVTEIENV